MSTLYTVIALFAILATGVNVAPAFAQIVDAITVTTDQESYNDGDLISISGQVRERLSGYPVTLQIIAANGNLVTVEQLDVSEDNTYGTEIAAGGALWRSQGEYTIKVLYGTDTRTAETTFEFSGSTGQIPSGKYVPVEGNPELLVGYSITGGRIVSIAPDIPAKSLIVTIEPTSDDGGQVKLMIPREVIDARNGADGQSGEDIDFFVLVDGSEVDFDETTTASERTLTIPFEGDGSQIEIIGTWVIPEFGAMAAIILAVAIVAIVAVSARTRLSIMPRY
ncbi:PEFG-CTERM sorting domain-containing protein [Candidatus Nitrosotenuis chungbukensis]|uniref:PEFG-CTERM sorting domain-containing protein n=1 Tax=Candidatus Nitrosotenuis chungbukensis TaxID=1353246 RepID=UPI002672213E|nr:PEFG-CTERM sorting domain-containing protein [Candidatus Nitrosotenuis chungbukensis]WKT58805.1 PEFG-CTERM sorting domain-containing protein [Candidatus Nitrosotenuis chungbukensis]